MWVVVHVVTGLALARSASAAPLWILLIAALLLHALLDLIPHWDYTRLKRRGVWACADLLVSVAIASIYYWVLGSSARTILVAAVSALPDLDVLDVYLPLRRGARWFPSHWKRFPHGSCGPAWGITIQAVVAALAVVVSLAV